jgi:hypothetical protein
MADKVTVYLNCRELYPMYEVSEPDDDCAHLLAHGYEVDAETAERWHRAMKDFWAFQLEVAALMKKDGPR